MDDNDVYLMDLNGFLHVKCASAQCNLSVAVPAAVALTAWNALLPLLPCRRFSVSLSLHWSAGPR